ncbi:PREDICTED: uncharacterized protein LOC108360339, partial [Rhagoletis zephyria]|uniref:uncharacterized protein LOC108360339 n=1 Tax=Rhagoletis zephyria TaxID=28612 RepID=UPI00081171AA
KLTLVPCLLLATVTTLAAALPHQRLQRDVSELVPYNYLPPGHPKQSLPVGAEANTADSIAVETEAPASADTDVVDAAAEPEAAPVSAVRGAEGYQYRAVRRLKYRQRVRRDVSHLSATYLPPNQAYLPPNGGVAADDSDVVNAALLKEAPIYLPPTDAEEVSTVAPIVVEDEVETEPPALPEDEEPAQPDVRTHGEEEGPQDSGVLLQDGYHYKQPVEEMPLPKSVENEYLPPLEQEQTEAVGPEESAVLADDGYHYRAIRRLRL